MIEFQHVGKDYPDGTRAVGDVSLSLEAGSCTVLVGSSGSGKTTLLRMVNRMVEPSRGRVLVDGRDVREANPVQLRREIGYVMQGSGLLPHRTVLANVETVPLLRGESKQESRRRALQDELKKTILFVTHDMDEALLLADRIVVLRPGGEIAQDATPEEIVSAPADDFVRGFLGLDSAQRALHLQPGAAGDVVLDRFGRPLGVVPRAPQES